MLKKQKKVTVRTAERDVLRINGLHYRKKEVEQKQRQKNKQTKNVHTHISTYGLRATWCVKCLR